MGQSYARPSMSEVGSGVRFVDTRRTCEEDYDDVHFGTNDGIMRAVYCMARPAGGNALWVHGFAGVWAAKWRLEGAPFDGSYLDHRLGEAGTLVCPDVFAVSFCPRITIRPGVEREVSCRPFTWRGPLSPGFRIMGHHHRCVMIRFVFDVDDEARHECVPSPGSWGRA